MSDFHDKLFMDMKEIIKSYDETASDHYVSQLASKCTDLAIMYIIKASEESEVDETFYEKI